ncbi:MAG: tRNA preQ1(34) S-adenosylmethionine ribosyltransferase-isomerase QueA [Clostridia bacterium]|nr:tRNA preQ1(34) S-adenosylmethionine ribosyltransferase-isomerase QueA [Clostridia bacterium]
MDAEFFNKKSSYNYFLPQELIAQTPAEPRDSSRLLVCKRDGNLNDDVFKNIGSYLVPGDVLVINESKVIPARLFAVSDDRYSSELEILLLRQREKDLWECLVRPGKKAKTSRRFLIGNSLAATVEDTVSEGNRLIRFDYGHERTFFEVLDEVGNAPLPPYITKKLEDKTRYQTVYAKTEGSAAAPTAGLHFTKSLIEDLKQKGVIFAPVTLHVGLGTFRPVKTENVSEHVMHSEYYSIPARSARIINEAKSQGRRVICVGTTSCRTLEGAFREFGEIKECSADTDIFIKPGYEFKVTDALVTNFHLPESTLIMLVCSLLGYENTMAAYKHAVEERYRFFSFGDSMIIL